LRLLVTGVSGFAGTHLRSHLVLRGHEVVSLATRGGTDARIDVRDASLVRRAVEEAAPDGIFHLAALAFVPAADDSAACTRDVNVTGTANVLDAARDVGVRTLVVSSGAVYGRAPAELLPVSESSPLAPVGAYAESKAAAEAECERRREFQEIVRVRAFNHTGPGQSAAYVCSAFARQIAEIERGAREPIVRHGELRVERDFCDVRDVVRAYADTFEQGRAGEVYNVCSGKPVSIAEILETLMEMSSVPVSEATSSDRVRSQDLDRLYGSAAKLRDEVGWAPLVPLRSTLGDLLDDWRRRVREPGGLGEPERR
jgi:GDP-4-dehydro-6-deoxy-D-mannose reductase